MKKIRNLGAVIQDSLREEFIRNAFRQFGKTNRLLDLGCGNKPFYDLYSDYCESSVGIDVPESIHGLSKADLVYDGKKIPFPDGEFDYVLCTEVMEHTKEPSDFLSEIYRVLKNGGVLIMTTPFMVPLHEAPNDFFRFTNFALGYLADKTGFKK